jgi:hypothetical protein
MKLQKITVLHMINTLDFLGERPPLKVHRDHTLQYRCEYAIDKRNNCNDLCYILMQPSQTSASREGDYMCRKLMVAKPDLRKVNVSSTVYFSRMVRTKSSLLLVISANSSRDYATNLINNLRENYTV